jgi:hypothetical protein
MTDVSDTQVIECQVCVSETWVPCRIEIRAHSTMNRGYWKEAAVMTAADGEQVTRLRMRPEIGGRLGALLSK